VLIKFSSRLFLNAVLLALVACSAYAQGPPEAAKLLPDQLASFRARGAANKPLKGILETAAAEDYGVASHARRVYTSADGKAVDVYLIQTASEGAAYSLFTRVVKSWISPDVKLGDVGTVSDSDERTIIFAKGRAFVQVSDFGGQPVGREALADFARTFAATLRGGENGLPVLVSHLPDWEGHYEWASYAVTLPALREAVGNRPVLDAVTFEGGAEAVVSNYGETRLVIIEFPTPQHAFDADAAVTRRIAELSAAGQPVPSSYKRVGNYSVFVFDAPDSAAAEKLASGVKYEKDVRWLGRNPHGDEIAIRAYTNKMGGVILTTLITTGLAILGCLTVGGVIGGAIFLSRRAKNAAQEIYSDAGGMLRLNIEDLNTPPRTTKMLGRGED
jgi:hypothetical protein